MTSFVESEVEEAALAWLEALGWERAPGADFLPDAGKGWRDGLDDVVLPGVLRGALRRLNPNLPDEAVEDAFRKITRLRGRRSSPATGPSTGCSGTA